MSVAPAVVLPYGGGVAKIFAGAVAVSTATVVAVLLRLPGLDL